jgi:fructose-bisphosphate aldolase class II/tagatose 1,6-diphosphate aldolase GatY/KbaY
MSSVPTAVLFNEARTVGQIRRGLEAGCNAVMQDTSHLPFEENLAATREVVALARAHGADVEVELGALADARDPAHRGTLTDPAEARRFVEESGIDALAVSVGSVHSMAGGAAALDLDRLAAIHAAVPVPLVLHGGSGIPASAVRPAAQRGVAKINYGMRMKLLFLEGVREGIAGVPPDADIHAYVGAKTERDVMVRGQARVRELVAGLMKVYGSSGRV